MQSQNQPPTPQRRQQRPQPLQQPENVGRTKLPAGIMMLSPKDAVSPRPVLGQLSNANNTAPPNNSSDDDSNTNSQFSGTAKSKHSYGVPEASPSPDKIWKTPSAASSQHDSPDLSRYRSQMQSSPSGYPSPTDTDMYMDEEQSTASTATPMEAPTDMYTFATAAASIMQQAREEEDAQSVSDASSAASADATPLKNYRSSAPVPNRNETSVMDSYRNTMLGTPPAPSMMAQTDKYGNDLNPLSPFRTDYTYSEDEDESFLDISSDSSTHHGGLYGSMYTPRPTTTPKPNFPGDRDDTPVKTNISPKLSVVSPYRPGARETPPDESAIDWQNYHDSSPPRGLPSMLGDSGSCDYSGAELESPARFLKSTREEETPVVEEPTKILQEETSAMDKTPEAKEASNQNAPDLDQFYSKPGLESPGERSIVFALDDCKTLAKIPETPGAKSIEFSLDLCQADPELAMKPFLKLSNSKDSTAPEDDILEDGMFKPVVSKKSRSASNGATALFASKKKKGRGDKEASSSPSTGANVQVGSDDDKPKTCCFNFSLRCKLFGILFLALLVAVPMLIGLYRDKTTGDGDFLSEEANNFQATDFPSISPPNVGTETTGAPTIERSTSKRPTNKRTLEPTLPTVETKAPTLTPIADPTLAPVAAQTQTPTQAPTKVQTGLPTTAPVASPTQDPTKRPTSVPTLTTSGVPTAVPTQMPTKRPTSVPTLIASGVPTGTPTEMPTKRPTSVPTLIASGVPTGTPTEMPTKRPTSAPTLAASGVPTQTPTKRPTNVPSLNPSITATAMPTIRETDQATPTPSLSQTRRPTTGAAPIGRPSRPLSDGNAPIGRPSLGSTTTVGMEPEPTLSPIWSALLVDDAVDDTNLGETHWPQFESKDGLRLEILSTLDDQWKPALDTTVSDWNAFGSVELTVAVSPPDEECEPVWGKIKICNDDFGETNWRSSIEVYFRSDNIFSVSIRVNDFYKIDQGWAQYTLCHQLGHAFGLGNALELNCMRPVSLFSDAVSIQLQAPDQSIGELLDDAYGSISGGQRSLQRKMKPVGHFDRVARYHV
ncbi:unnamed protein product [Cylindrotheca closterium]|uniref:Peptidase M10 metallopeptidase domain-containing protein n=1 Tax=Cylindrotheca closterium TaxID=2856 RepID=A0AAD2CTP5_9STRA|nr:unnamed protein product [Cylindrotheca closterium]